MAAPVAVPGLVMAWCMVRYNGRTAYPNLFGEELAGLVGESLVAETDRELRGKLVDDAIPLILRKRRR